ncbi:MAG: hypothetical protein IKA85_02215 [Clostridia bacterium]|nr:hypothetical protein [Clostridia bacterium]
MIRVSLGGSLLLLLLFLFMGIMEGFWEPFFVNLGLFVIQIIYFWFKIKDSL